jgi:hypothetical protein
MVAAAGLLLLFVLIAAVAVEVGIWLHAKRDAQNDVDAMVLAGAQDVEPCGGSDAEALAVASQWADRNNVDGGEIESLYVDSVLNPGDAVYAKLSRDVDTLFGGLIGLDEVTVSAEAEALCSFARMAQGLRPWLVQEEPSEIHSDEPCFESDPSGTHYGGSPHYEPLWGQSCVLTWNGGQGGKGEFGPADIEVALEPPDCTDPCPHSGAVGYRHAIVCGSLTTYCVYEEIPACPDPYFTIPQEPGQMGQSTRDAISDLLAVEPVCGDPNGNGIDDWEETFDLSGPIPVAKCLSPRVIPIFIVGNWLDPEIHPKTHYIYHFAALYLEGCTNSHHPDLDPECDDPGNFQQPGQTQVSVRFGELMSSASAGGGQPGGYINVVNLIK